jgi:hypothetical protein
MLSMREKPNPLCSKRTSSSVCLYETKVPEAAWIYYHLSSTQYGKYFVKLYSIRDGA